MKPRTLISTVLLGVPLAFLGGSALAQQSATATTTTPASTHVALQAADIKWGAAPPAFEQGAQFAVLSGDPGKPGPFVIRMKAPAGYKVANHWHPSDEQVTLIEGDATVQMDDGTQTQAFSSGAFVQLPARMHHAVSTTGGMTVQVAAMGPFELTYVDPKDDPRKRPH
jgi:mannose-6-phosphate isomerase-like protein (cupin superfamily)